MCPVVSRLVYVAQDAVWFHAKLIGVFIAFISMDYCSLSLMRDALKAPYFAWFCCITVPTPSMDVKAKHATLFYRFRSFISGKCVLS
jgi:hypothetical protein